MTASFEFAAPALPLTFSVHYEMSTSHSAKKVLVLWYMFFFNGKCLPAVAFDWSSSARGNPVVYTVANSPSKRVIQSLLFEAPMTLPCVYLYLSHYCYTSLTWKYHNCRVIWLAWSVYRHIANLCSQCILLCMAQFSTTTVSMSAKSWERVYKHNKARFGELWRQHVLWSYLQC